MSSRLSWSDVRGGLIALAVIVGVSVAILKFSRVGSLHGDTIRVYALVGEARGLSKGSEVWLSGQKVGKVTDIQLRSPALADTGSRVMIEMELLARYRDAVHRDATAQIRSGGSIVGAAVLYLTPGTVRTVAVRDGDTVRAEAQSDVENATSKFAVVAKELPPIMANVKLIIADVKMPRSTVGAFMNGGTRTEELRTFQSRAGRLMERATNGRGTVGMVMNGDLGARVSRVMARADSVRALLASNNTSLGRFRRDSTLLSEVADIRNEVSIVQALLAEPRGTAGRVMRDTALTVALGDVQREMTLLFADIKSHPFRYLSF